jgi:hypothetical protein
VWKSPRGGVNRRNLKFTTLNIYYKPRLALELKSSPRESGKTNQMKIKRINTVICFTEIRFQKTSPRWGGHKDRVSFKHFPLSNGHLDRVSFLLNQTGHLDPVKTTTHLISLALITSWHVVHHRFIFQIGGMILFLILVLTNNE